MSSDKSGLLLVMMEVDPEHEDEFNEWYNTEHLTERTQIPGFISGRRFRAVEGAPKYLALYELQSPDIVHSEAYLERLQKAPTPWTLKMRPLFKSVTRNVYEEITPEDEEPRDASR